MHQTTLGNGLKVWDVRSDLPDTNTPDRYNFQPRMLGDVDTLVIHHWASVAYSPDLSQAGELAAMRVVYNQWRVPDEFHNTAGYPYHFTIFPSGRIYWNGGVDTSRAHVARHNDHTTGVSLPGNFMTRKPGPAQLKALQDFINHYKYAMGPGTTEKVVPHGYFGGTACPGATFGNWGIQV